MTLIQFVFSRGVSALCYGGYKIMRHTVFSNFQVECGSDSSKVCFDSGWKSQSFMQTKSLEPLASPLQRKWGFGWGSFDKFEIFSDTISQT